MGIKETVGKIYTQLKNKIQDKATSEEVVSAIGGDFMPKLVEMIEKDKYKFRKVFYVEVCIFMNPIMPDVPEYRMRARHTCPTPFHDRGVFKYDYTEDAIHFLWFVPSPKECHYLTDNALKLHDSEKQALQTVLDYKDGTLLRLAKKLNGETENEELIFYRKDEDGNRIIT